MTDLLARLESAPEGSRETDGDIALSLGWKKRHKGWAHWTSPDGAENQHVPFFSTSIDAKLPDEDIIEVKFDGEFWWAWDSRSQTVEGAPGMAHTEPLARRIAALRAREAT